jgi:DNA-directed RNA polymerase alpha subunit
MSGNEKSANPVLSASDREPLREGKAQEALVDHEQDLKAFHENEQRLRQARLAPDTAAGTKLDPTPELPDLTLIERVQFSTRIRNALNAAGMKSIGDVREASDATLLSLPDLGPGSVAFLREKLGLPSTEGVRPRL